MNHSAKRIGGIYFSFDDLIVFFFFCDNSGEKALAHFQEVHSSNKTFFSDNLDEIQVIRCAERRKI